jgi:hypothetical protein
MTAPVALAALLLLAEAPTSVEEAKRVGGERALDWLGLVDRAEYVRSWQEAGAFFREKVAREQWVGQVKAAREPLGKLDHRAQDSASYAEVLPGAPPGAYVVFVYRSSFAKLPAAFEQVTVSRERDGSWRVVGYYIRPAPPPR